MGAPVRLVNDVVLAADASTAWALLADPAVLAACLPGADAGVDGATLRGSPTLDLGAARVTWTGTATVVPDEGARSVTVSATGRERGGGDAAATLTAALTSLPSGGSRLRVISDVELSGRSAQFGRGVLAGAVQRLLAELATGLDAQVTEAQVASAVPAPPADAPATGSLDARAEGDRAPLLLRVVAAVGGALAVGLAVRRLARRRS